MNILLSFFLQRKHKSLKKKSRTYVSVELVLDGALIYPLYILYVYLFFFFWRKSTSPHYSNTKEDHKLQIEKV